jgi:hypothetical protein
MTEDGIVAHSPLPATDIAWDPAFIAGSTSAAALNACEIAAFTSAFGTAVVEAGVGKMIVGAL